MVTKPEALVVRWRVFLLRAPSQTSPKADWAGEDTGLFRTGAAPRGGVMGVGFAAVPGATACPALEGVSAGLPVEGDLAAGSGVWLDGADAGAVCGAGPART